MSSSSSRLQDLSSLRYAKLDVALVSGFAALIGGPFLVGFLKEIGANDVQVNLLSVMPALMGLMQIVGAVAGRRYTSYKRFVAPGGLIWRLMHFPLIVMPLVPGLGEHRITIIIACLALASFAAQLVDPIYNDWLAEMIPANSRGWFFSTRNAVAGAVGAVVGLIGAIIFDRIKAAGYVMQGYTGVFAVGCVLSLISMYYFLRMSDRVRANPQRLRLRDTLALIAEPYGNRAFRVVLLFLFVFVFGQVFMGGLLTAYALETLQLPLTILQITGLIQASVSLACGKWWGYFADRYGNKPMLAILCLGICITPAMWFFTRPGEDLYNFLILIPGHVIGGIFWSGVGVCQFNLLLKNAPEEKRANYIAAGQSLMAMTGALAPFLGGLLMQNLRAVMPAGSAYLTVLGVTTGLRFLSVFFLLPVREAGSAAIGQTLKQLTKASPTGFSALKRLTSSPDVDERERAIASVGERSFGMAADEIIKSLHDPTPKLRRQAARTLAQIGDEKAVEALVHQLEHHPDLVEEETIISLGRLGSPIAGEVLIRYLKSPRPQIRRSAAWALGRIGGSESAKALIEAAGNPHDPDLRRSSLQALRALEVTEASEVIAMGCLDRHPSVRIAASEAATELGISDAAPALRESIVQFRDEATSEVAYALGALGQPSDIPAIMEVAGECVSMITRRRCLLGVARLLGVERESYRLFLQEGLARDSLLLNELGTAAKTDPGLKRALAAYSSGDEARAIQQLAKSRPDFESLTTPIVDEAFIVAALGYARAAQEGGHG